MRVKSCAASDGGGHIIQLSDEHGCVLRPKMISRFLKARIADERASVITYAFFHAFKFPDALSVHIKCKVEICRHGCLDHCQLGGEGGGGDGLLDHYGPIERKDPLQSPSVQSQSDSKPAPSQETIGDLIYDELVNVGEDNDERDNSAANFPVVVTSSLSQPQAQQQVSEKKPPPVHEDIDDIPRPFQVLFHNLLQFHVLGFKLRIIKLLLFMLLNFYLIPRCYSIISDLLLFEN